MLTVASPSVALTLLPRAADDLPQAGGPRGQGREPAGGTAAATTAPAAGAAAGTAGTARSRTVSRAAKPASRPATKTKAKAKTQAKPKPAATGYAKASSTSSSKAKSGALAFLDDPRLSMEEKLLKLLGYLNDKWNKELDQKMKEFKRTATSTSSSSASSSGGAPSRSSSGLGGVVKKVVGYATAAIPQLGIPLAALKDPTVRAVVKNVAGPALAAVATAVGQPALAALALECGPEVVDAAASAVTSGPAEGSTPAASAGTRTTTTKDTAEGLGSDKDDQLRLMEMQRILDQQKEMFSLVSNMLRTTHETRMSVIQNVR